MSIRVKEYTLEDKKINDDKVIVNISDVHSNIIFLKELVNILNTIKPDIITFTGDVLDYVNHHNNVFVYKYLKEIASMYNIYICLGNHDILQFENKCWTAINDYSFFENLNRESEVNIFLESDKKFVGDICITGAPEFVQGIFKKSRLGLVGPYNRVFMKNAYGFWNVDNTSLIISNGVVKIADSIMNKNISKVITDIFVPDIDVIKLKRGNERKLILDRKVIHR